MVTPRYLPRLSAHDETVLNGAKWQYESVDCRNSGSLFWFWLRLRRRCCGTLARRLSHTWVMSRAGGYALPELERLARAQRAHLYIAHTQMTLPIAARVAQDCGAALAADIEDLLADCSSENVSLMSAIETRYLRSCGYVSTMSSAASRRLQALYRLQERPLVLHNTPSLRERSGLKPPVERVSTTVPSIYWFGQTIGPHSCAHYLLQAIGQMKNRLRLVLRGNVNTSYVQQLMNLARANRVSDSLEVMPLASPNEMVRLAGDHDLAFGSQPSLELFHQMAIGNKVFTGMMAGLALVLTDTIAHRELLQSAPGCGFTVPINDARTLSVELDRILSNRPALESMKQRSYELGDQTFNWDQEARQLLTSVSQFG